MNKPVAYNDSVSEALCTGDATEVRLAIEGAADDELLISLGLRFMIREFCLEQKGQVAHLSSVTKSADDISLNIGEFTDQFDDSFTLLDGAETNARAFLKVKSVVDKAGYEKSVSILRDFMVFESQHVFEAEDYIDDLRPAVVETLVGSCVSIGAARRLREFRGGMYQVSSYLSAVVASVVDFSPEQY